MYIYASSRLQTHLNLQTTELLTNWSRRRIQRAGETISSVSFLASAVIASGKTVVTDSILVTPVASIFCCGSRMRKLYNRGLILRQCHRLRIRIDFNLLSCADSEVSYNCKNHTTRQMLTPLWGRA